MKNFFAGCGNLLLCMAAASFVVVPAYFYFDAMFTGYTL